MKTPSIAPSARFLRRAENPFSDTNIDRKPFPLALNTEIVPDGTPVAFTGFPLINVQPITSEGIVGTYRDASDELGPREIVLDKNAWPGASGSPLYTSDGRVIGMVRERGFENATGLSFARSSAFIKRFLDEKKPKPTETPKAQ